MRSWIAFFLFAVTSSVYAQEKVTVTIEFEGLRSSDGQILMGIYTSNETFKKEKPLKNIEIRKRNIKKGKMRFTLDLPEGEFGFSVCDDENGNGEMDYNFVGMPKEGFGFSDFYLSGLSRPMYDDFSFEVRKGMTTPITIKLRYM